VAGNNIICVEVHQSAASSSDMHFSLYLNGLSTPPCYGEAMPGVRASFEAQLENIPGLSSPTPDGVYHQGYVRNLPSDTGLQFQIDYQRVDTGTFGGFIFTTDSFFTGALFPTNCLWVDVNSRFTLTSEPIDTRNFRNIKGYVDLLTYTETGFKSPDFLRGWVLTSSDGVNYTQTPWFDYKGTSTSSNLAENLVTETSASKWKVPTAATDDATWFQKTFVDTSWSNAAKGLGYENSPGDATNYVPYLDATPSAAIKTQMYNVNTSIYARYKFTPPSNVATYTKLELHLRWEDGFAAYLNGTKVKGDATTNAPTPLAWNSAATADRPDTTAIVYQVIDLTANKGLLTAGENVLAIHGLNASKTSSDMLIQAKLIAYKPGPPDPTTLAALDKGGPGPFTTLNTGTLIADGVRSVKFKFSGDLTTIDNQAYYMDNIRIAGDAITPNNFGTVMNAQLPAPQFSDADRENLDDPDGDHIPNLLEYAFGGNASQPKQTTVVGGNVVPLLPTIQADAQGYVTMKYRRLADPAETLIDVVGYETVRDLEYRPQISFDGIVWSSLGSFTSLGVVENEDGTVTHTVKTTEPVLVTYPSCLFRVKVFKTRESWLSANQANCPL
jgi:hypothetical protein